MTAHGYVELGAFLLLGGAASASSNSASGKVVVGWFPKERRGLAMGIRQMCQPLGVTIAALTVPAIAAGSGLSTAFVIPLVTTALLAILTPVFLSNPPRSARAAGAPPSANPYRTSGFLWRIHLVSILLVVPQFTLSVFGLVWLITQLHVPTLAAGVLVGVAQFVGALGRVAVGILSDRVASRMRPLRWVAISAVVVMVGLGLTAAAEWQVGAIVLVIAMTVTVADNGLAFTSVAEMAGPSWSGRALGAQNTGQFIAASVVGPLVGGLIGLVGYPIAFLLIAVVPAIAVPIIPKQSAEIDRL
jgi:MFS family permease